MSESSNGEARVASAGQTEKTADSSITARDNVKSHLDHQGISTRLSFVYREQNPSEYTDGGLDDLEERWLAGLNDIRAEKRKRIPASEYGPSGGGLLGLLPTLNASTPEPIKAGPVFANGEGQS